MKPQPSLEQKLRMMIIDDVVFGYQTGLKIDSELWGEKYAGLQERYKDIFTIDKALTFQDPGVPCDYWAKFRLKDIKYDLIVLDYLFDQPHCHIQQGWEILKEIRKVEGVPCPLNADTFVLGYSTYYLGGYYGNDRYRNLSQEEIVKRGLSARVTGNCVPRDLFVAIDKYLAEEHPKQLARIRR